MKKGIIMEIKRDILVMMTPEGEFLTGRKQPNQKYAIGEEIPFFPMHNEPASSKRFVKWNWKVSTALLTSIIVILTLFSSAFLQSNQAYAYVSVDINPSMELTLNKKQQVIEITPYNHDAKVLIKELGNWEELDVSEVTEKIFLLCEELGYLNDNQNVLITSSFLEDTNSESEDELITEINQFAEEYSTDHNMNITVKETSQEMRKEASNKGMTAGSLLRETEKAETPIRPKTAEDPKAEVKEEDVLKKGIKIEEKSKVENQKVKLPSVEKKQKPENHPKNDKPLPNDNKQEKPENSHVKDNPSDHHKWNKINEKTNDWSNRDEDHSRGKENRSDHEDRKDEKKRDHKERKDNKKYKDD
ncbi:MAG: anti-sigma factor domain-containing protein [Bacillota bacterium]